MKNRGFEIFEYTVTFLVSAFMVATLIGSFVPFA